MLAIVRLSGNERIEHTISDCWLLQLELFLRGPLIKRRVHPWWLRGGEGSWALDRLRPKTFTGGHEPVIDRLEPPVHSTLSRELANLQRILL